MALCRSTIVATKEASRSCAAAESCAPPLAASLSALGIEKAKLCVCVCVFVCLSVYILCIYTVCPIKRLLTLVLLVGAGHLL
jgi:hypothetical protein